MCTVTDWRVRQGWIRYVSSRGLASTGSGLSHGGCVGLARRRTWRGSGRERHVGRGWCASPGEGSSDMCGVVLGRLVGLGPKGFTGAQSRGRARGAKAGQPGAVSSRRSSRGKGRQLGLGKTCRPGSGLERGDLGRVVGNAARWSGLGRQHGLDWCGTTDTGSSSDLGGRGAGTACHSRSG